MAVGAEAVDEIVVVGSGPAGVSVSFPLLEAGLRVRMLDAGADGPGIAPPGGTIGSFRGAPDRWMHQFGGDLGGLRLDRNLPPKPATPRARAITGTFPRFADVQTDGFLAFGALSAGGLSGVWGALAPAFDAKVLAGYPIKLRDLEPSYAAVRARIGIAAERPVAAHLRAILDAYERRPDPNGMLRLQPAENAVRAANPADRRGCVRCGLCLWGCQRGSIYNSAAEIPDLRRFPAFSFEPGVLVRRLHPAHGGHLLELDDNGRNRTLYAPRVILAAGTLASTALVFHRLGHLGVPARLLNNPVAAMAFAVPRMFGAALPKETFSLAQLLYEVPLSDGDRAVGALYSADGLPLDVFAGRLPFTRPAALRFGRLLAPALVLTTCYLPSRYSHNTITITAGNDKPAIDIRGETTGLARDALLLAKRRLTAGMRRLGALSLPGGFAIAVPGTDAHCAGTIPMLHDGNSHVGPACNSECEVRGVTGLFVVDGAALPSLPARHCTLTIMANADRVGRRLAARITGGP